jgi:hypothetical protein
MTGKLSWIVFGALGVIAVLAAINVFAFSGRLFPNVPVVVAATMAVLAAYIAITIPAHYGGRAKAALRDVAIWLLIACGVGLLAWIFR